jgi:hypothetical protein
MPVRDALAYLHGSGTAAFGPDTSTANAFTAAIAVTGVMTVSAVATGQLAVGQQILGAGIPSGTIITSLGTGVGNTGTYNTNLLAVVASEAMTSTPNTVGDPICAAGSQYSNLELDFGAPNTGGSYPFIAQFPSLTEKTYGFPPEVVGEGGVTMGLHIIVDGAFNLLTSINFEVCTSATTAALFSASPNPIAARTLTLAQLQVAGAHYFIPVMGSAILEFLRFYAALTGTDPTCGTITAWYGPKTGGEQ